MISLNKISIPNWISCHTYFFDKEESRTYISNEKNHEYIQLDGISSDFWKLIYDQVDDEVLAKIKDYVDSLGYFDEVLITRAGCVISSHCGYGTLGILYVDK